MRYRFGAFEIAEGEGVLRRQGARVRLPRKAAALLLLFLERAGQVCDKQDLMQRLWPDVFVDENNLNQCVSALRRALGDDAAAPRFVETVARHGFRFIAAVEGDGDGRAPPAAGPAARSLAVLPFRAAGGAAQISLGSGLAETLIARLSRVADLSVRSASAVRRFQAADRDACEAGRELGAALVLDGSIRQHGDRIRVGAELVRVADATVLWADSLDERLDDLFALEDRLTRHLAAALHARLRDVAEPRPTADVAAYQLYLMGRHHANELSEQGFRRARHCFEEAIGRDPAYALAWAGLAYCHLNAVDLFVTPREAFEGARRAADQALALAPGLAEALICRAGVQLWYDLDRAGSEASCREALEAAPDHVSSQRIFAWYLVLMGRGDEALERLGAARAADPWSLENYVFDTGVLYFARRYGEVLEAARRALALFPGFWVQHVLVGRTWEALGELERALAEYEQALPGGGAEALGDLGRAYGLAGRECEARAVLRDLEEMAQRRHVSPFNSAVVHFGLGETERALDLLEETLAQRSWYASWFGVVPFLDRLAEHPRYVELCRRAGTPAVIRRRASPEARS